MSSLLETGPLRPDLAWIWPLRKWNALIVWWAKKLLAREPKAGKTDLAAALTALLLLGILGAFADSFISHALMELGGLSATQAFYSAAVPYVLIACFLGITRLLAWNIAENAREAAAAEAARSKADPDVSTEDRPHLERIIELIREHEKEREFQPFVKVVDAEKFIIISATWSEGRNPLSSRSRYDLRKRKELGEFGDDCTRNILRTLYFLEHTPHDRRGGDTSPYQTTAAGEWKRADLEPWFSMLDIVREMQGFI